VIRLDQGDELRPVDREERNDKSRALRKTGIDLRARIAQLQVGGG